MAGAQLARRQLTGSANAKRQLPVRTGQAGADAAEHYALIGGRLEDRDPGPWFSTRTYFQDNPDVAERALNAPLKTV